MSERVLIVGAGSLGTLYGAVLARACCEVQLLARPAHAEAIAAAGGVQVEDPAGHWTARLRATADPAAVEPADTVLLLTQVQDGPAALAPLEPAGVRLAVSLQNGGGTERALEDWCGHDNVASATSMVGATLVAPGRVAHTAAGPTYLGPGAEALAARLESGGLETIVTERIRSAQWSKLVNAAATMTITALPRLPLHVAFTEMSVAYVELVREGAAVARRSGVEPRTGRGWSPWPPCAHSRSRRRPTCSSGAAARWRPRARRRSSSRCCARCRPAGRSRSRQCTAICAPRPSATASPSPG